ncbi:hypothetical protein M406DRAFT_73479 [Cryphonectria parasitica EP155]|uniref:Bromo domain-containing protein n=1 Tax=Cryphonectria parasitica (strain ATCC 38755 / EP155) TaxID=660469 RepID=A0A9P4XUL0_CRYP1|nr:uncharacterized protein M406DRAFT_73479 [Cryphonectria parasitica EP155]KAF3761035.1 hypothetical protein M406DRAFT_73479 [Cryphonectria parasitica EP155]
MEENHDDPVPSDMVVIDSSGAVFISLDYVDKIPATPPDLPVSERFFLETPEEGNLDRVSITQQHQIFVSLQFLNILLATAKTEPLRAELTLDRAFEGVQKVFLRLVDLDGHEVSVDGKGSAQNDSIIRRIKQLPIREPNRQNQQQLQHYQNDGNGEKHVIEGSFQLYDSHGGLDGAVASWTPSALQSDQTDDSRDDDNGGGALTGLAEEDNVDTGHQESLQPPQTPPSRINRPIIHTPRPAALSSSNEPTPAAPTHRSNRPILVQLQALQLTDNKTLSKLLNNTFTRALDKLERPRDHLLHLATLATGQVCTVRIFEHIYARGEDLGPPPDLNDPELSDRPITTYQIFELWRILRQVARTEHGREFWPPAREMWPAQWSRHAHRVAEPVDMSTMRKKLFRRAYASMGAFRSDVDRLRDNAERFFGEGAEVAMAARRTVDDIYAMMGEACAVGPLDVQEPLFLGLVRKLVIDDAAAARRPHPKFVLPLGTLHVAARFGEEANPTACFLLMDVTSPRKALWLFCRSHEVCRLVMLADDIKLWRLADPLVGGGDADDDDHNVHNGGLMGRDQDPDEPSPRRNTLMREYPESKIELASGAISFKRAFRQQALQVIKKGWRGPAGAATRKRRHNQDLEGGEDDSDADWTPLPKRRRIRKSGRTVPDGSV